MPALWYAGTEFDTKFSFLIREDCHAIDDPPTTGRAEPSTVNFVAIDCPVGPSMAAMDGPAGPVVADDHLRRDRTQTFKLPTAVANTRW